jgi:hypothetical protein
MPPFPPGPPENTGVVLVTLSTGLEVEAEWDGADWWMHLDENPSAAPLEDTHVVAWRPME